MFKDNQWKKSKIIIQTPTKTLHVPISICTKGYKSLAIISNLSDYAYFYLIFNSTGSKTQYQYEQEYSKILKGPTEEMD